MDDHSRSSSVSTALAHHQRSMLVMEALARGIAAYGTPQEILTDQGRQYAQRQWRGETDFEQELRRQGIRHVKSRPQHPQTLGKVERFWKTLWGGIPESHGVCGLRRLRNGASAVSSGSTRTTSSVRTRASEGLVPADRFFRSAPAGAARRSRRASRRTRSALALEQPARKPFYLVGRLGDRDLETIAAAGSGLRVQMGDEQPGQTIRLPKVARR